jgi:hypothetical protein
LFPKRFWAGIEDGTVTVAFRRQKRPTVKVGGTLQTPGGVVSIDELTPIEERDVTATDARAAGYTSREEAVAELRPEGQLYRVRFHRVGDDPRRDLREQAELSTAELDELGGKLVKLDWALPTLALIAERPGTVSTELAEVLGYERLPFKARVRRLKALGLTESLLIGYRLSPRGVAVLAHLRPPAAKA